MSFFFCDAKTGVRDDVDEPEGFCQDEAISILRDNPTVVLDDLVRMTNECGICTRHCCQGMN